MKTLLKITIDGKIRPLNHVKVVWWHSWPSKCALMK